MRIVKERAAAVLRNEGTKLAQQMSRCEQQVNKLSGMSFGGLLGKSVTAAEQNVRMRSAIATAHLTFYRSLLQADRTNAQLVAALPTTSGGVLDTVVAQNRAQQARGAMKTLEAIKEQALEQARRTNEALVASADPYAMPVNIESLRESYDSLIQAKKVVAELNEDILKRAAQYEQDAAGAYRGVEASYIASAVASSNEYLRTGGWGSVD